MAIFDVPHILPIAKVPGSDQSAITKTMPLCKDCQENMPRSASHLNQNTEPPPPQFEHTCLKKIIIIINRDFLVDLAGHPQKLSTAYSHCVAPFFLKKRYCPQGTVAVAMGMVEASTLYGHDRVDCM